MPVIVLRFIDCPSSVSDRPTHCPYCGSEVFQRWGTIPKKIHDTSERMVEVFRYHCSACGHTFRSYPQGIDRTGLAERIRKLAGLVWILGLSCREVVNVFKELGIELSNMTIWREGEELVQKFFNGNSQNCPPQFKIDKIFNKYQGKVIGTIIILDLGKDKKAVLGRIDEVNPQVFITWLDPFIQDLKIMVSRFGTDILDRYNAMGDESL